jgi:hypothetical protein
VALSSTAGVASASGSKPDLIGPVHSSVTKKHKKHKAKKAKKTAVRIVVGPRGPQGPVGPAGANGANGVQGPAGGFDPSKVQYVAGPKLNVVPGGANTSVAICPAGTKVIGGGYFFGYANGGITVETSGPLNDGSGWLAGFGNGGTSAGEATAYAVCAA